VLDRLRVRCGLRLHQLHAEQCNDQRNKTQGALPKIESSEWMAKTW
jgi:hypothetical protein